MGITVIRLKAIKYKENSFCYIFSYFSDLSLQVACLLTLFFRLYALRTFVSLEKRICLPKSSQISDLNKHFELSITVTAIGLTKSQGVILVIFNKSYILPPVWWSQRLKALCKSNTLPCNYTNY